MITAFYAHSQEESSWKVKLNGKTLLSTSTEDEKINSKKITISEWKKNGSLEISYTDVDPSFWIRSFLFVDENDQQLFTADSTTKVKITLAKLRKIFAGKKKIVIYIVGRPTNPDIAVRIRRVHLCTLKLP